MIRIQQHHDVGVGCRTIVAVRSVTMTWEGGCREAEANLHPVGICRNSY